MLHFFHLISVIAFWYIIVKTWEFILVNSGKCISKILPTNLRLANIMNDFV